MTAAWTAGLTENLTKMSQSNFPTTIPAMTMTLEIGIPMLVGSVSRGTPLTVVPITGGKIVSDPAYSIQLDSSFVGTGNDYIHNDPDGKHMRLDTHAVVRDTRDDLIYVKYRGIIDITSELSDILGGSVHAKSTDFGHSFIHIEFESGSERYRGLELGVFVAAGRFLVDEKKGRVSVEYKISQVVSSTLPNVKTTTEQEAGASTGASS